MTSSPMCEGPPRLSRSRRHQRPARRRVDRERTPPNRLGRNHPPRRRERPGPVLRALRQPQSRLLRRSAPTRLTRRIRYKGSARLPRCPSVSLLIRRRTPSTARFARPTAWKHSITTSVTFRSSWTRAFAYPLERLERRRGDFFPLPDGPDVKPAGENRGAAAGDNLDQQAAVHVDRAGHVHALSNPRRYDKY